MINLIQLEQFLRTVDRDFPIPISQKQYLTPFARKLMEKATICSVCENGKILSLVAGYTENLFENMAYISIVATLSEARGKGYAMKLVKDFISCCRDKKIKAVHLYTAPTNVAAIKMYKRLGFQNFYPENEPRPEDMHLIYFLGG